MTVADTVADTKRMIGRKLLVQLENLEVMCHIRDAQNQYGVARVQIEPVSGKGTQWVNYARLRFDRPKNGR